MNRRSLEDILQKPLGPYHDRDVLNETECQMTNGRKLVLYSFVLEHNGRVTGYASSSFTIHPCSLSDTAFPPSLDESERPLDNGPDNRKFRFRGLLKISDPSWLSEFGVNTVETELNLRAGERAMREGERRVPPLTVKGLFESKLLARSKDSTWKDGDEQNEEIKLVIKIQGEKNLSALFMQSCHAPDGLSWSSKAHYRNYEIATMDVETYSRSENFFWRWRLLKLVEKIANKYAHIVPVRKRTPKWFVNKYITDFATPAADKHRRIIYDEDDSDIDERGRTRTPRSLLKPHTSEVLGLFAAHAEWLVTNGEVRRNKLLDLSSWMKFAQDIRRERKEATEEGVRWGWPVGVYEDEESQEGSGKEGSDSIDELSEMVRQNPVIGKANKVVARKIQLAQKRANLRKRGDIFSDPESSSASSGDEGGATYASDFSEQSVAVFSDSDSEGNAAVDQIPWPLQGTPTLPDVDGRWLCPVDDCKYQIDLHRLTEEDGRGIPQNLVQHIMRRQWRNAVDDKLVLEGLGRMVKNHYSVHYLAEGVKLDAKGRFKMVNGRPKRRDSDQPILGPMPAQGTLGGELRVVPTVHIQ